MPAWEQLLGPAVVAAFVSLAGAAYSIWTSRRIHRERLDADHSISERKLRAEIEMAQKKFDLERSMEDWKRRVELAEHVLADFYKAQDIFASARSPLAFRGEGASRIRKSNETEAEASLLDAIYAPFERLEKHLEFLTGLHARRFRFKALFGSEAEIPFLTFVQAYKEIALATRALLDDRRDLGQELRAKFESTIGWAGGDKDTFEEKIEAAVDHMERICKPVLELRHGS